MGTALRACFYEGAMKVTKKKSKKKLGNVVATISFDLPEEKENLQMALDAWQYKHALEEVWNKVFRPMFKHGYSDEAVNKAIAKCGDNAAFELVEALASLYNKETEDLKLY